jgi:CRISPR-associated endonuclease Cas1
MIKQIAPDRTASTDNLDWAVRNEHWHALSQKAGQRRAKRERSNQPLILCGHGVTLRIEHGALTVRNGFTHYPQERQVFRFFKGDLALPPRIIMLDGSGTLSFDVVAWLAEQNVPLFRIDWTGDVVSVIGGSGFSQDHERVRWQMETRADPDRRLDFCAGLIAEKVRLSIDTMKLAVPDSAARVAAIGKAEASISLLEAGSARSVMDIRMIEARAASAYFTSWRGLPIRWKSRAKFPVPAEWETFGSRRTVTDGSATNRHARHPVNAMLNYAYALMNAQVRAEVAADGYDPRLGIMHETRPDALAYVLDMIELRRPLVDRAVLRFVFAHVFSGADFSSRDDGVCRLTPQLAKRLCEVVR